MFGTNSRDDDEFHAEIGPKVRVDEARSAVDPDFVPSVGQAASQFFGKGFEAAI